MCVCVCYLVLFLLIMSDHQPCLEVLDSVYLEMDPVRGSFLGDGDECRFQLEIFAVSLYLHSSLHLFRLLSLSLSPSLSLSLSLSLSRSSPSF